jgi:hypothetical protein
MSEPGAIFTHSIPNRDHSPNMTINVRGAEAGFRHRRPLTSVD